MAEQTKNSTVAAGESGGRKAKMRSLALDLVPMGTDEENRMADLKVSKTLPDGIESKMLYSDIVHIAWPSLVELTLTQLASMVDLMMVGQLGPWALTSTITATLRGVGNSKTAMIYNAAANILNVFFNYMLIYGHFGAPRMEVAGASLATIIGQYCAMFMAFYAVMNGRQYLVLRFKDGFKPNKTEIGKIVDIGAPAMVEQLVMRAGMIIYTRTVAGLGTLAYAVHQVCMNIQSLSFMNGQAFAVSATSLSGQSLGRKRHDMAQAYISRTRKLGMCVSIFLGVIFFFFGGQIVALYSGGDQSLVDLGGKIMMFVALVQQFQSSQLILAGALRGAGDTKVTAVITFLTVLLVRPALAIFAINVLGMGLEGAWVALVIDQILRSLLVLLRYNSGAWKRHTM